MPGEFEDAERGFWTELFDGMLGEPRDRLGKQIDLVQGGVFGDP